MQPRATLGILLVVIGSSFAARARAEGAELPQRLIALDSAEGERLLVESKARQDYFHLSETFVAPRVRGSAARRAR